MRRLLKDLYFNLLDWSFFNRLSLWRQHSGVTILTYHSVVADDAPINKYEYRNCVTRKQFSKQIAFLKKHFKIIPLEEAVNRLSENQADRHYAVITFDDGYKNNFTRALPVVKQHGITATFFITTGLIDSTDCLWTDWITYLLVHSKRKTVEINLPDHHFHFELTDEASRIRASIILRSFLKISPFENSQIVLDQLKKQAGDVTHPVQAEPERYAFLNWEDVKAMSAAGMDIGTHTHNHIILKMIPLDQVRSELQISKNHIEEKLNRECQYFAYPNGGKNDFTQEHINILKELKFRAALTQIPGINHVGADLFRLKRINISSQMTLPVFKAYVSGSYHKK